MEQFIIEGGARLEGTITPAGNKNAALPALIAGAPQVFVAEWMILDPHAL